MLLPMNDRPWPKDPKMKPISDFNHLVACYMQCFYPWMTDHDPKTPRWNQYLISITLLLATCDASTLEWQTMTQDSHYIVAHDANNPLTSLVLPLGHIQAISRRLDAQSTSDHWIDSWIIGLGTKQHQISRSWRSYDLLWWPIGPKRWPREYTDTQLADIIDHAICRYHWWLQLCVHSRVSSMCIFS